MVKPDGQSLNSYNSETEQKIFDSAREIFIRDGRDGARMEEIARHAGINKALLHYYFRSKEKLYQEIFRQEFKRMISDLSDSLPLDLEISLFLLSFINNYIDRMGQNSHVIQFMLWEIRSGGENMKNFVQELFSSDQLNFTPHIVINKLQQAMENREIRQADPHQLLLNIISMCLYTFIAGPIIQAIFPKINTLDRKFINNRKKEIFELVWNGIKP
jgi:AcrR family transcriptional regulator